MRRAALLLLPLLAALLPSLPLGATDADPIEDLMAHGLNPALTRASDLAFQRGDALSDAQMEALNTALQDLQANTSRVLELSKGRDPNFASYAVQLQVAVAGFSDAAMARRSDSEHWLSHVAAACNACHQEYR